MTDHNLLENNTDCQRPEPVSNLSSEVMSWCQKQIHDGNNANPERSTDLHPKDKANNFLPSLSIDKNELNFCPAQPSLKDKLKIADKDKLLPPLLIINNGNDHLHLPTETELNSQQILSSNKFDSLEALKQTWTHMQKHHPDYESVNHTKDGQLKIGLYGMSAEQIENFLAVMGTASSAKTLDKFVKEHILTNTMEKNLKDPKFREKMKEFVQDLENGTTISKKQFKKFFPRQVQEAMASFHIERMQAHLGKDPGAVVAALEHGRAADTIESSFKYEPWSTKTKADKLFHTNIERQETILEKAEEEKFKDLPNRIPENERRPLLEKALRLAGVSPTESNIAALQVMVQEESSWEPKTTNYWDINAKAGTPSRGLIQTIPETFKRYAIKDYDQDITDPTSNLVAGIRYTLNRYGSLQRTPGIVAMSQNEEYKGY